MKKRSYFLLLFTTFVIQLFGQNHLNIQDLALFTPTNRSFKCHINGKDYFFRIGRDSPELIGINREREIRGFRIGEQLGIAPALLGYEIENGLLITEFLEGTTPTPERMRNLEFRKSIVSNFRLLHDYPVDVALDVEKNMIDVCRNGYEITKHLIKNESEVLRWLLYLDSFEKGYYENCTKVCCHGDIYFGNLLETSSGKVYFIDWEYSHIGYAIDDLGKFCSDLTEEEIRQVVEEYWGDSEMFLKMKQNTFMHSLFHFFWCHLQAELNPKNEWYCKRAELMREFLNHATKSLRT